MNDARDTMFFTIALWLEPHHFHLGLPLTLLLLCTSYNSQQAMLAIIKIKKKRVVKNIVIRLIVSQIGKWGMDIFFFDK